MQRYVRTWITAGSMVATGGWASPVGATYSIAAVDQASQQVGGAITSCVGTLDVGVVYGSAPGFGVVHAQALLDQRGRAKSRAIELLMQDVAPADVIAEITAQSFDAAASSRQYGVVDLSGRAAGFTGDQAQAYKADQQGSSGTFFYSVQGNILTSQKVLDQASTAFEAQGCDLAERLMLALEAGADNSEGDSRCTDQGIPSDSAFIEVDRPGEAAGTYLKLSVSGTAPQSPLVLLREQFDAWRAMHPCESTRGAAGQGGPSSGASGDGAAAAGDSRAAGTDGSADAGGGAAPAAGAGSGASSGAGAVQSSAGTHGGDAGASGHSLAAAAQSGSGGVVQGADGPGTVGEAGGAGSGAVTAATAPGPSTAVSRTFAQAGATASPAQPGEGSSPAANSGCACASTGRAAAQVPFSWAGAVVAVLLSALLWRSGRRGFGRRFSARRQELS